MDSEVKGALVFALVIGLLIVFPLGVIAAVQQMGFYVSAVPAIEQLRGDVKLVGANRSEDVVGQVTQWNQTIAVKKRWNRVPLLNLWIPDGWDRIEAIEIPQ